MSETDTQTIETIRQYLLANSSENNRQLQAKLALEIDPDRCLGVYANQLNALVRKLDAKQKEAFLNDLPHEFLDEDLLHVKILNTYCDVQEVRKRVWQFLGCMHSWIQTDSLTLPAIEDIVLLEWADLLLEEENLQARRLGMLWIMKRGIRNKLDEERVCKALRLDGQQRCICMMQGWLLCEGMIWRPDFFRALFEDASINLKARKMGISKCLDSHRVDETVKKDLKNLRTTLK